MKTTQTVSLNPANAVLVIVDVQNEFCKPGGGAFSATSERVSPGVIKTIGGLAARARAACVPVIYVQSVRTLKEAQFTVYGSRKHLEIGTWSAEIVPELAPQPGDTVVQKHSHDPFFKTELDAVLTRLVPHPTACCAVVTGGTINVCVYHTLMGLYLRDYWTVVPEDAVFYIIEEGKQVAMNHIAMSGYPNIFFSRSDLIHISDVPAALPPLLSPGLENKAPTAS